ncbi:hypothetical protein AGR4C_Lc10151 [Agrobacterium tumefaciens str. Kerr 14]|uniref:Uncharacterized protein n=1 Tax=Agrobacterium tumefaciens str. Kerr 14 TaxID=1183424 RepID=A0A1S7R0A4_AGRTU|nr:hypothetical protein AGR4C_Lc10151 [Agrobacterium tumefaciens str. Kerr 14]
MPLIFRRRMCSGRMGGGYKVQNRMGEANPPLIPVTGTGMRAAGRSVTDSEFLVRRIGFR